MNEVKYFSFLLKFCLNFVMFVVVFVRKLGLGEGLELLISICKRDLEFILKLK